MNKYKNSKIIVDSISFDSLDESKYYQYLKQLQAKDKIVAFEMQPKFELIPKFEKAGKRYRAITYSADFTIYHINGEVEYVDIKGLETQQGILRGKLFNWKYPDLKLTWIARSLKYGDEHGWIEYDKLKKLRAKNKKVK
jgi:hypothetical protein